MSNGLSVLHVDSERGWRGGQQQAVYLYENLLDKGLKSCFVCRNDSKLETYFKSKNLPFLSLPLANELDILSAYKIAKFCKKNKYNILHLHSAHALTIGLIAKLFFRDLITIGVRRVDFSIKKNVLSQLKYKTPFLNQLVAISEKIKNVLIDDGLACEKISVIRSGININKFDSSRKENLKEELNIPSDYLVIGTVAALVGHKDYPNLLKAAKIVAQKIDKVVFLAAGSGKNEAEIKNLHKILELKNKFLFLGYRTDIGNILKNLDIFVIASKEEGLGTSTLDAMSVGLPVIGTNAGGIPEVIANEENGYIVPKQNPEELAEAIINLLNDENKRNLFSKNSLKIVRKFDIQKNIEQNINLYKRLINETK